MQPNIINRRYYDDYFFNLAQTCSEKFKINVIYENLSKQWIDIFTNSKQPMIVIYPDYLTDGLQMNRFSQIDKQRLSDQNKKCLVLSSVKNAHQDHDFNSVQWLHHGSDFLFQMSHYPTLSPVDNKNFDKAWHCVSLSFIPRKHRLTVNAFLLGEYYNNCFVKCNLGNHNNISWQDFYGNDHSLTSEFTHKIEQGWNRLFLSNHLQTLEGYNVPPNHNALNFDLNLKNLYTDSIVEFVNETTFYNQGIFVSEKYLNSVYGFNFPIIISNAGTVDYLRNIGFDMFDDIINHDYDLELDNEQRIIKACTLNRSIIEDKKLAKHYWYNARDRFVSNYYFAKTKMYRKCTEESLKAIKQNLIF
jgi:hypothetical protein